jgi:hypothetical protein
MCNLEILIFIPQILTWRLKQVTEFHSNRPAGLQIYLHLPLNVEIVGSKKELVGIRRSKLSRIFFFIFHTWYKITMIIAYEYIRYQYIFESLSRYGYYSMWYFVEFI